MLASRHGHEGAVRVLLEFEAAVDFKRTNGETALMVASQDGHEGSVRVLLAARVGEAAGRVCVCVRERRARGREGRQIPVVCCQKLT